MFRTAAGVAKVEGVVDLAPIQRQGPAGPQIHVGRIARIVELDPAPTARTARVSAAANAAQHALERIAADQERRCRPIHLVADVFEAIVRLIGHFAGRVGDECLGDQGRVGSDVLLACDRPAARRLRIGHPGIELEERVQVMPPAAVENLDGRVSRIAPTPITPWVARRLPKRGQHRVFAAAQRPAVDVDQLQRRNSAGFAWIGVMVIGVAAEVVDRDRALVVRLAVLGDRLDNRRQGRAVGRPIVDHLHAVQRLSRGGNCEHCDKKYTEEPHNTTLLCQG